MDDKVSIIDCMTSTTPCVKDKRKNQQNSSVFVSAGMFLASSFLQQCDRVGGAGDTQGSQIPNPKSENMNMGIVQV